MEVRLRSAEDGLLLEVEDDGRGFDPSRTAEPGHLGLSTITERAELAGGWCSVESEPGLGTVVRC